LRPGLCWEYKGTLYTFSDIRQARCGWPRRVAIQGRSATARVADARSGGRFLTLDSANPAQPALYLGDAVTLKQRTCSVCVTHA
jgi:hypothetical protein